MEFMEFEAGSCEDGCLMEDVKCTKKRVELWKLFTLETTSAIRDKRQRCTEWFEPWEARALLWCFAFNWGQNVERFCFVSQCLLSSRKQRKNQACPKQPKISRRESIVLTQKASHAHPHTNTRKHTLAHAHKHATQPLLDVRHLPPLHFCTVQMTWPECILLS